MSDQRILDGARDALAFIRGDDTAGHMIIQGLPPMTASQWRRHQEIVAAAVAEERERCAKVAEQFGDKVLNFYDRPGGPPGNGWVPLTGKIVAGAIRKGTP